MKLKKSLKDKFLLLFILKILCFIWSIDCTDQDYYDYDTSIQQQQSGIAAAPASSGQFTTSSHLLYNLYSNKSSVKLKHNSYFKLNKTILLSSQQQPPASISSSSGYECKWDSHCGTNSVCINGNCLRVCSKSSSVSVDDCVYIHCDSKQLITSSSSLGIDSNFTIETNNYPYLNRYMSKKKCSWILKNLNQENRFIQLRFDRFNTEMANDYLYIFSGDSIFSPLIGALSGNRMASLDPSQVADYEAAIEQYDQESPNSIVTNDEDLSNTTADLLNITSTPSNIDRLSKSKSYSSSSNFSPNLGNSLNITINADSIYLLFKTDSYYSLRSTSSYSSYNFPINKPSGISMRYKFSSCNPPSLCTEAPPIEPNCSDDSNINCNRNNTNQNRRLVQTIKYLDEENNEHMHINILNSTLRRSMHCSFEHKNYMYIVGGYSFAVKSDAISFISRMNIKDFKWEHSIDRRSSTVVNRSNRRYYSNMYFKQPKLDLPQHRYAHSCVVDEENEYLYMYGGIKYAQGDLLQLTSKQTTNELWMFNLQTNKWTLLSNGQSAIRNSETADMVDSAEKAEFIKNYGLPVAVSGHSMQLITRPKRSILIFFGYSEYHGTNLDIVQEFDLELKTWSLQYTFDVNIGYAHSSVHDKQNNNIYFYGGIFLSNEKSYAAAASSSNSYDSSDYHNSALPKQSSSQNSQPFGSRTSYISSLLYIYDVDKSEWKNSAKSPQSCYLHSSSLYNRYILFYGGICINDNYNLNVINKKYPSMNPQGAYISNQLRIYDINENKWFFKFNISPTTTKSFLKLNRRQRYGHTSVVFDNSVYIYAGFNGFFLKDLFKINLSSILNDSSISQAPVSIVKRRRRQSFESEQQTDPVEDSFGNKIFIKAGLKDADYVLHDRDPLVADIFIDASCNKFATCFSCHSDTNCIWNMKKCQHISKLTQSSQNGSSLYLKKPSCAQMCSEFRSCMNCTFYTSNGYNDQLLNGYQSECVWCSTQSKCIYRRASSIYYPFGECLDFISERSQCEQHIRSPMSTTTTTTTTTTTHLNHKADDQYSKGFLTSAQLFNNQNFCINLHSNCSSCIRDDRCGWCTKDRAPFSDQKYSNDSVSLNTGYGTCMEGGEASALGSRCKYNWFFSRCPTCECNGHSTCTNQTDQTDEEFINRYRNSMNLPCGKCLNNTYGEYCSECKVGYYGNAKNNGKCLPCDCGQQANFCDSNTGRCFCNTKGVIGAKCDQCDTPRYTGRPTLTDGSCFYNLTTDYQFTFNLNKDSDRFYTRINFVNHAARGSDDDIDFMVRCYRETALINITYVVHYNQYDFDSWSPVVEMTDPNSPSSYSELDWPLNLLNNITNIWMSFDKNNLNGTTASTTSSTTTHMQPGVLISSNSYYFGPYSSQTSLLARINCTTSEFKYTFYNRDLNYADKNHNATFIVYVYDFQTPITIQIAFSRRSRVQLLHFFITFFGCLLTLLTIAFITWKTKQRYDRYRRQRQIVLQMEHMASRPFTRLFLDVSKSNDSAPLMPPNKLNTSNNTLTEPSRFKKSNSKKKLEKASKKEFESKGAGKAGFYLEDESVGMGKAVNDTGSPQSVQSSKFKLMPVAVEPLSNNKTAIVTCLLKLPQGDLNCTPKGSSPFILASAFVQITSSSSLVNNNSNGTVDSSIFDDDEFANDKSEKSIEN